MKKLLCMLLAILMVVSMIAVASADAAPKKISLISRYAETDNITYVLKTLTDEYNALNPDKQVELELNIVPATDEVILVNAASGDIPDIMLCAFVPTIRTLASMDMICDMEELFEQAGYTAGDFDDVCDEISKKLIVRHPHVFGDVKVADSDEVLTNWDAIKRATKKQKTTTESILSIPRELPALMRAQKTQHKAAKVGFDWDDVSGALEKVGEEAAEVKEALASGDPDKVKDELGDLLFAAVNVCRFGHTDAEEALTGATDKFTERFRLVEQYAAAEGKTMTDYTLNELDGFWERAKKELSNQ